MTSPNTHRQPESYFGSTFGGGQVLLYPPSDEEKAALAAKNRAEGNRFQAEADEIQDSLRWSKWIIRRNYALFTICIFSLGIATGAIVTFNW